MKYEMDEVHAEVLSLSLAQAHCWSKGTIFPGRR